MITEQYVSFETAKLLKEKGFDVCCKQFYEKDGYLRHASNCSNFNHPNYQEQEENILLTSAPSQSLTMRWLREVHGLFIEIHTFYESEELPFACRYQIISNNKDYESMEDESDECFYTYEEAVEAAITECLECYL